MLWRATTHLVCQGLPKLIQDRLEDGLVQEVERMLEGTGGETQAHQGESEETSKWTVCSEPSEDSQLILSYHLEL